MKPLLLSVLVSDCAAEVEYLLDDACSCMRQTRPRNPSKGASLASESLAVERLQKPIHSWQPHLSTKAAMRVRFEPSKPNPELPNLHSPQRLGQLAPFRRPPAHLQTLTTS